MFITKKLRRWLVFFVLFLFVLTPIVFSQAQGPQEPPDEEWKERKGLHYIIRTTASMRDADKLLKYMEAVYRTYTYIFNYKKGIPSRFIIKFYKNKQQFHRAGAPAIAGAYYSHKTKELIGYYSMDGTTLPLFAHEGFHQFNHMYFREAYARRLIPIWLDEGLADCIGNSELRGGKIFAAIKNGVTAQGRLPLIQKAIKNNKYYPLKKFIRLDRGTFMKNAHLCYAQAWSFCHFLLAYPLKEDKRRMFPAGDYYYIIGRLYEGLTEYTDNALNSRKKSRFKSYQDIYNYAFQTKDGDPIDLDELEKQWKDYVLKFNEKEGKEKEQETAAVKLWQKSILAYSRNEWNNLPALLGKLKTKYKKTDVFKNNKFDITQLSNIAKWKLKGKTEPYEVLLFSGKKSDLANWKINDIEENSKAWRLDRSNLIGESSNSYFTFKGKTILNWTFATQFKFDKPDSINELTQFTVCFGMDPLSGYFGLRISPSDLNARLFSSSRSGLKSLKSVSIKEQYKKEDWNEVVVVKEGAQFKCYFNNKEIFSRKPEKPMQGRWSLQIHNGRVCIKSITLKLK